MTYVERFKIFKQLVLPWQSNTYFLQKKFFYDFKIT